MRKHRAREYLIAFQVAAPESLKIPLAMLIMIATARFLDEVIGPGVLNWLQPTDSLTARAELRRARGETV